MAKRTSSVEIMVGRHRMTRHMPLCRHCRSPLTITMADLGTTPIANDYVSESNLDRAEPWYPLRVYYCDACHLVQLQDFVRADDVFRDDYAYFSSQSKTWVDHAELFVDCIIKRFNLNTQSHIAEIASNDGYLLQHVIKRGVRATGIEPCHSVADYARRTHRIPTLERFFGETEAKRLVDEIGRADLTIANNVLAHVPDILDFVKGFSILLAPDGVATFEFPHLLNLIQKTQFDTIYHEHFSYLSLIAVEKIFENADLRIFDVEELPTHGGSLRLYTCHKNATHAQCETVQRMRYTEIEFGLDKHDIYRLFSDQIHKLKYQLVSTLIGLKQSGHRIAAYGAPAKGNTLLNVCGIRGDIIDFTVDSSPSKQGNYLPGTRIPIHSPDMIFVAKPDIVMILPWNLESELMTHLKPIADWGGKLLVPVPEPRLIEPTSCS